VPLGDLAECLLSCVRIKVLLLLAQIPELPFRDGKLGGAKALFEHPPIQSEVSEVGPGSWIPVKTFADAPERVGGFGFLVLI
jgi:hypothetical protein